MKSKVYSCDFETSTEKMVNTLIKYGYMDKEQAYVWLACAYNIDNDKYEIFNNINDFMGYFSHMKTETYFHNLKFDGKFILAWLLKNGYTNITGLPHEEIKSKTYNEVIDEMGNFYSITIYFNVRKEKDKKTGKTKNRYIGKMTIKDSLKRIPMSVEQMGKAYNVNTTKMDVPEEFYDLPRKPYPEVIYDHEIEYIVRDCKTVAEVIKQHNEEDMVKNTVSGNALYQWKKRIRERKKGESEKDHFKRCEETVNALFPKLSDYNEKMARESYKGGWTYCKEERSHEIKQGSSYDVCSLYPSVMRQKALPYGEPLLTNGKYIQGKRQLNKEMIDRGRPFKIMRVETCFNLKPNHVPSLMAQGHLKNGSSFLVTSDYQIITLTLTSVDLELFKDHYEIHHLEIKEIQHYKVSSKIFNAHIDYWYSVKESQKPELGGNSALYQLSKLMLNSLYGKFGNNIHKKNKTSYLDNSDQKVKFLTTDEQEVEGFSYVAMASAITSYAREKTIRSAQANYDRFVYGDTDSLYLKGKETPDNLDIGYKLGQWNKEHEFERGRFIKQKTYIIEEYNKKGERVCMVKCAGMSKKCKSLMNFDNFKVSGEIDTKMFTYKLKTLEGGCHLVKYDFKIKVDKSGNFYANVGGQGEEDNNIDTYFRG